jgi:5-methylcytosine-specific restriction endonuclease McrA
MKFPKWPSVPSAKRAKAREKERDWQRVRQCVLVRDGYRCRVCRTREGVDVHHVRFRSVGGEDSTANCAAICRVCHAECHAYRLVISGDANSKLKIERSA